MKKCYCCSKEYEDYLFVKHKNICKKCLNIKNRDRYQKVREHKLNKNKLWRKNNRDKVNQKARENYAKTKEYQHQRKKNWREQNKESVRQYKREYMKQWRTDPINKLHMLINNYIRKCLIRKKYNLTSILGYSLEDLVKHLESKFKDGMNWSNRGIKGWHIDHIIPLKYKKEDGTYYWNQEELSDPNSETFKKAWSLDNLQPLWWYENLSKNNRFNY